MTAYQKYQLQWMIDHDHPLDELVARMAEYQVDCNELGQVDEIFNEWEYNVGFGGEIWVSYLEWKLNDGAE